MKHILHERVNEKEREREERKEKKEVCEEAKGAKH